jgi:hypothetical protein
MLDPIAQKRFQLRAFLNSLANEFVGSLGIS